MEFENNRQLVFVIKKLFWWNFNIQYVDDQSDSILEMSFYVRKLDVAFGFTLSPKSTLSNSTNRVAMVW